MRSPDAATVDAHRAERAGLLALLSSERMVAILVPFGAAVGPAGLGLLSESMLLTLGPVVFAAAAGIGVFVAFGLDLHGARRAVHLETMAIVAIALVTAWMHDGSWARSVWVSAQASTLAVAIAVANGLLVSHTTSDGEQRAFTIGTLLLIGGASAQLSVSPLLGGVIAGAWWRRLGSETHARIHRDMSYLRHPLLALLLLVAGARVHDLAGLLLGGAVAYALCRLAVRKMTGAPAGRSVPPGLIGIAAAAALRQVSDSAAAVAIVTVVVVGSVLSEFFAWGTSEETP